MRKKPFFRKRQLLRWAGTLITLVLLVFLLNEQGWDQIGAAIWKIPLWRIVAAFSLMLISRLAVTLRWFILLRSSGMKVSALDTIRLTFSGLFASNFLPTTIGGDVIRLAGAVQLKLDATLSTASLVVDRLVGMVGMATVLPFGLPQLMSTFLSQAGQTPVYTSRFTAVGSMWLNKSVAKLKTFLFHLVEAFSGWAKKPGSLFLGVAATWLHMICLFSTLEILLVGMNEHMSIWLLGGLWSAVYFLTLIPISINGYGLQEISVGVIFAQAGGIAPQSSLTLAILIRTLTMLASLPGAVFIPGILASRSSSQEMIKPEDLQGQN